MTHRDDPWGKPAADADPAGNADGTIRIEHDRKRLALATVTSGIATIALPAVMIANTLHPARAAPAWTLVPVGLAVLVTAVGFVRNIVRLQDGDPALVISPRGLNFRPYLFGEIVRIPWNAVRGVRTRRFKHHRFVVLKVDDIDRYAPRAGFLGLLRRIGRRRVAADEISFSTPMARSTWKELEATLKRYLARYGRTDAGSDGSRKQDGHAIGASRAPVDNRSVS